MSKKLKAGQNKANSVETKPKVEALWAKYGRLQAQREQAAGALEVIRQQMMNVYQQIQKIKE